MLKTAVTLSEDGGRQLFWDFATEYECGKALVELALIHEILVVSVVNTKDKGSKPCDGEHLFRDR